MEDEWQLKPLVGLGRLRFTMSPTAVSSFDPIFGVVTDRTNRVASEDTVEETLALFGGSMNEDQIAALRAALSQQNATAAQEEVELRREAGLQMTYQAAELVEIFADMKARRLHFDGAPFFERYPRRVLRSLISANGGTCLARGRELLFETMLVQLFAFVDRADGEEFELIDRDGEVGSDRSVTWYRKGSFEVSDDTNYRRITDADLGLG